MPCDGTSAERTKRTEHDEFDEAIYALLRHVPIARSRQVSLDPRYRHAVPTTLFQCGRGGSREGTSEHTHPEYPLRTGKG